MTFEQFREEDRAQILRRLGRSLPSFVYQNEGRHKQYAARLQREPAIAGHPELRARRPEVRIPTGLDREA
jgi:hypothetical protein